MEFNSSTGYQIIKKEIKNLLVDFDFIAYKSSILYRVTEEDILQFISFQKGVQSLSQQMTINVVLQGLFCPTCSFDLIQPGGRIGSFFNSKSDKWWACNNKENTEQSVTEIKECILKYLLPFFDKTATVQNLCDLIDSKELNFIWTNPYTFIDKGFFYLKGNHFDKALATFQSNQPSKVAKFKTIKRLIEEHDYAAIEGILLDNTNHSKAKWTI
ncbi:MAG: DUF4304 domain-containing protein [Ferruginibacter sp.]